MSKTYEVELSQQGMSNLSKTLEKIGKGLDNDDFNKFLMNKCRKELDDIMFYEDVESDQRGAEYLAGNHEEMGKNYIELYNDSEIDIDSQDTWLNDYGKQFYPDRLSLAELVEYGAGVVGAESSKNTGDEWSYMINPYRDYDEGWEWNNQSYPDFPSHTLGQEGRYIYYQLAERVQSKLDGWVGEYISKLIGGSL